MELRMLARSKLFTCILALLPLSDASFGMCDCVNLFIPIPNETAKYLQENQNIAGIKLTFDLLPKVSCPIAHGVLLPRVDARLWACHTCRKSEIEHLQHMMNNPRLQECVRSSSLEWVPVKVCLFLLWQTQEPRNKESTVYPPNVHTFGQGHFDSHHNGLAPMLHNFVLYIHMGYDMDKPNIVEQ
eukprot:356283-Pelagomonas_calceolata.AAC.3